MKEELLEVKNVFMDEILKIKQKLKHAKDISDNKMVSPNHFESLSLSNDDRDDFL